MKANGLHRLHAIPPGIEELARPRRRYGVIAVHRAMVLEALIRALDQALGDVFTALAGPMSAAAGEPTCWIADAVRPEFERATP